MTNSTEKTIGLIALVIIVVFLLLNFTSVFLYFMPRTFNMMERSVGIGSIHFLPKYITLGLIPIVLIFLWLFVIIWVYRDAERRKMSGVLWALFVLVGNIIGLLIYLIVRNDSLPARQIDQAATQPCPSCEKKVQQDFEFCPNCGIKLRVTCQSCGKPTTAGWKVCPYCEAKLDK